MTLNVVIVEDHPVVRMGLESLLASRGHSVVGRAASEDEGLEMIVRRRPDVSIVDLSLAEGDGADLTERLLAHDPSSAVMLYTASVDPRHLRRALGCGARGFALKSGPGTELMDALEAVAAGATYMDPALTAALAADEDEPVLSPREREILELLSQGLRGEEAAKRLVLSGETVRTHVRNAMTKLGARTRTHAVVLALARGEIPTRPL